MHIIIPPIINIAASSDWGPKPSVQTPPPVASGKTVPSGTCIYSKPSGSLVLRDMAIKGLIQTINSVKTQTHTDTIWPPNHPHTLIGFITLSPLHQYYGCCHMIQVDAAHWWWMRRPPPPPLLVKHFEYPESANVTNYYY